MENKIKITFKFRVRFILIAIPTVTVGNEGDGDGGEMAYTLACEELQITPAQRILSGLCGQQLHLKYRSLGPVGARALAAALLVG